MWHERQAALAQLRANELAHVVRRQPESLPTSARFLCLMPDSLIPNAFAMPTSTLSVSNRLAAIVIAAAIAKTAKTIAPGHGLVHIDRVLPRRVHAMKVVLASFGHLTLGDHVGALSISLTLSSEHASTRTVRQRAQHTGYHDFWWF